MHQKNISHYKQYRNDVYELDSFIENCSKGKNSRNKNYFSLTSSVIPCNFIQREKHFPKHKKFILIQGISKQSLRNKSTRQLLHENDIPIHEAPQKTIVLSLQLHEKCIQIWYPSFDKHEQLLLHTQKVNSSIFLGQRSKHPILTGSFEGLLSEVLGTANYW